MARGISTAAATETSAAAAATPLAQPARPARLRKRLELALLLGPALILFVGFVLAPIGIAVYYSLYNWSGFGPLTEFTGMHNYSLALSDPVFRSAIEHNVIIAVLSVAIQLPISIGLALLLNRQMRGRSLLRLVVFAPYVLSEAITAVIWLLMLQPGGFVDKFLTAIGLGHLVHLWLADLSIVLYTLFVVLTWKYIGFGIILLLAGLQGIPAELREAAAIDGASPWQTTRRIVLPLLAPTIRIWIFLTIIGSLQLFDIVWIMTGGGPANASVTMATYLINRGLPELRVRLRQRDRGHPVHHLLRVLAALPALRAAQGHPRRAHEGGRMSTIAGTAGRSALPPAPEAPGRRFSLLKPLTWLVVVLIVAITVVPLIFVIEGGFRSTAQINTSPVGLPHPWVWSNYTSVLFSSAFWRFLGNSAFIAVVATAGAVGFGSMAAFALSRIEFKGREAIFTLFTVGLLFPIGVASLPLYLLLQRIHLLDNLFGVAIPEAAFSLSITIVILRPVHARDPGGDRGRGRGGRRDPAEVLRPHPAAAVAARAGHGRDPGVRLQLEQLPACLHRVHQPGALHAAARRGHIPDPVLPGHGAHLRVHRAVDGASARLLRPRRTAHYRGPFRLAERLMTFYIAERRPGPAVCPAASGTAP